MLEGFFQEDGALHGFSKVSRPLAVTMVVAIPALGAMTVGIASIFSPATGAAMAANSTAFLKGIPTEIVALIGSLGLGYIGAKSWETRSPPPPKGQLPPEASDEEEAAEGRVLAWSDPSMSESGIDAEDYDRSTRAGFVRPFQVEPIPNADLVESFRLMTPRTPILGELKSSNEEDPAETPVLEL